MLKISFFNTAILFGCSCIASAVYTTNFIATRGYWPFSIALTLLCFLAASHLIRQLKGRPIYILLVVVLFSVSQIPLFLMVWVGMVWKIGGFAP